MEFGEVDIDLLADYIGGALDDTPAGATVAALIADDPAWRDTHRQLSAGMTQVGSHLTALDPEPMPAELAARLEQLFTADLPQRPTLALVHIDGAPGVPKHGRLPGRRMRWGAPIAVAAAAVALVGFGADYLAGRHAQHVTATSGKSDAVPAFTPAAGQTFHSGTDYSAETLAAGPMQAQVLTAPRSEAGTSAGEGFAHRPAPTTSAGGGFAPGSAPSAANLSPDLHPVSPRALEQPKSGADSARSAGAALSLGTLQRLEVREALDACLAAIERENGAGAIAVRSVDYARFAGEPAVVVQFSATNGSWGWASGPACGTPDTGAATLTKVPVR